MRITNTRAVLLAVAGGLAVVTATSYYYGAAQAHTPAGAAIVARITARYSGLLFAVALALRSLPKYGVPAMYAFVAAHFVHFAKVLDLFWVDPLHHRLQPMTVAVLAFGVLLITTVGITNGARPDQPWRARANAFTVYLTWLLFAVALGSNSIKYLPSAPIFLAILAGMGFHLYSRAGTGSPMPAERHAS